MVYRIYVEKKPGLAHEAAALLSDIRAFLGVSALEGLRLVNVYDVLNAKKLVVDKAALAKIEEVFA